MVLCLTSTVAKSALLVSMSGAISQLKWIYYQRFPVTLFKIQTSDEASRGPWGALMLAKKFKER